jgi:hypothetical protein
MSEDNDRVRAYLTAFRAFTAATARAEELTQKVQNAAGQLKEWRKTAEEPHKHGTPGLAPGDLPSGQETLAALEGWRRARADLFAAWGRIPVPDREGLVPPENVDLATGHS